MEEVFVLKIFSKIFVVDFKSFTAIPKCSILFMYQRYVIRNFAA